MLLAVYGQLLFNFSILIFMLLQVYKNYRINKRAEEDFDFLEHHLTHLAELQSKVESSASFVMLEDRIRAIEMDFQDLKRKLKDTK